MADKTKTIVVKLPWRMAARVVSVAKKRRVSKSELVRRAIARELAEDPWADVADLIGSAEGPGDLSTHPRHMEGYGED